MARVVLTRNSDAAGQRSERSSGYIRIARLSRQSDRPTGQLGEMLPFTERLSRSKNLTSKHRERGSSSRRQPCQSQWSPQARALWFGYTPERAALVRAVAFG